MEFAEILPFIAGIASFLVAGGLVLWITKQPAGTKEMMDISNAVKEGAAAFLKREMMIIIPVAIALTIIIGLFLNFSNGVAFAVGATLSAVAGIISLKITVKAAVRAANLSSEGLGKTFAMAFRGGATVGLAVPAMALLAITGLYLIYPDPITIAGVGIGASLIALFIRIGGGIFTKAADMGADLVGKVEVNIPEDDPRNPATIADNVGDNVGDCAGMGADLYETYVVTLLAAMLLAMIPSVASTYKFAVEYPIMLGCVAIVGSIIGTWFVRLGKKENIMGALYKGLIASGIISAIGFYFVTYFTGNPMNLFLATLVGLVITILINVITEYYTSTKYRPVKKTAEASVTGAGTNLIYGLAVGMESTILPIIVIVLGIVAAYLLAGVYGIAIAAVAMLSLTGVIIALDSYGPITDNAGGIAEMAGLDKKVRKNTDALDAVGNTTKAVTKGYAVGSAALGALALFVAFTQEIKHVLGTQISFLLTNPAVMAGLIIGAMLPFAFSAVLMRAVGTSAHKIVVEVRRQFKEIKGIMTGKGKPDYAKCVDIVTKAALANMILPAVIAVAAPLAVGMLLGIKALGGLLIGVILSGLALALFMSNSGATWDNAKKYIEDGNHGGKGKDAHKAAVVGDTVGDPFKDTAGPALNALIKVINTLAIVFAPLFVVYGLNLF